MTNHSFRIPRSLKWKAFEALVAEVGEFVKTRRDEWCDEVVFDFNDARWLGLSEAAGLAVLADWITRESEGRCKVKFVFPSFKSGGLEQAQRKQLESWLHHFLSIKGWGYVEYLLGKSNILVALREDGKEVPYRKWIAMVAPPEAQAYYYDILLEFSSAADSESADAVPGKLKKKLEGLTTEQMLKKHKFSADIAWIGEKERGKLCDTIINALCQNIVLHAYRPGEQPRTGLVAMKLHPVLWRERYRKGIADKLKKAIGMRIRAFPPSYKEFVVDNRYSGLLEILVVDGGRGTVGTLRERFPKANECELICKSFEKGVTCRNQDENPHYGMSLYYAKKEVDKWRSEDQPSDLTEEYGGLLEVRCGRSRVIFLPGNKKRGECETLSFLPGTHYHILLPTVTPAEQRKQKAQMDAHIQKERQLWLTEMFGSDDE